MNGDGLLLWQRLALERGEPIDVPPHQRNKAQLQDNSKINQILEKPGEYRIDLPWPRPPLNHNQRLTYWAKAELAATIRADAKVLAKQAKIPCCERITVQMHYAPGRRGRRDPMNLTATTKPLIDGLVDAGIVPDDDTEHVHEEPPRIHFPPEPGPRCWLIITRKG